MRRLALLLLILPLTASAQTDPLFPRFSVTGAYGKPQFDTKVRIDPENDRDAGTEISLERDLGLPGDERQQRFTAEWRPFARHQFDATYFTSSREGGDVINRDIVFRDRVYPVNAYVQTRFNLDYTSLAYTYWAYKSPAAGIGVSLGAASLGVDASLTVTDAQNYFGATERANTDVPVALGGVQARFALGRHAQLRASAAALPRVTIEGYTGRAVSAGAALEYRPVNWLGLGAAYDYFKLDVDVNDGDLRGTLGMKIDGPQGYVRLAF